MRLLVSFVTFNDISQFLHPYSLNAEPFLWTRNYVKCFTSVVLLNGAYDIDILIYYR